MTTSDQAKPAVACGSVWVRWPLHVPIVPLFFVLSFYHANASEFPAQVLILPAAVAIAAALVLCAILWPATRSLSAAAAVTSLVVIEAFAFGHVHRAIGPWRLPLGFFMVSDGQWLIALGLVVTATAALALVRWRGRIATVTVVLNLLAVSATGVVCIQLAAQAWSNRSLPAAAVGPGQEGSASQPAAAEGALPDIYHIVLDGYARNDVLLDLYGYDNSAFTDYLTSKGFYVAERARANYAQTALSLASALDMRYLDEFAAASGGGNDRMPLVRAIRQNRFCRHLRGLGYRLVCYPSGYWPTETIDGAERSGPPGDSFARALLDSTILSGDAWSGDGEAAARRHRRRVRHALDSLAAGEVSKRPVFVFAHIVCPHPPFVFDRAGETRHLELSYTLDDGSHWRRSSDAGGQEYRRAYIEQLQFINTEMFRVLDAILSRPRPAVIVLQSDHGPGSRLDWDSRDGTDVVERLATLLAARFADGGHDGLYEGITPVNAFRATMNHCFGAKLEPLGDRSYFSPWPRPYDFMDVTAELEPPATAARHP